MIKKNFFKKTGGALGSIAIAGAAMTFPLSSTALAEGRASSDPVNVCPAIELIEVNGTGASNVNKDTNDLAAFMPGWELKNRNVPDNQIHTYSIAYPAQAGTIYNIGTLFGNLPRVAETTATYGQSRAYGAQQGVLRMEKVKAKCPNTKFGITGYSQGAHVAGDISSFVSAGKVKGVSVDDIVGTVLWGDPNRSGNSEYQGGYNDPHPAKIYAHPPSNTTVQRNLEWLTPGDNNKTIDNRVGWAGPRKHNFVGQQGKVISLCSEGDLACSVAPGTSLRKIADMSDKDLTSAYNNIETMRKVKVAADELRPQIGHMKNLTERAVAGDRAAGFELVGIIKGAMDKAGLNLADIPTLLDGMQEISKILQILGDESEEVGNAQDILVSGFTEMFHAMQNKPEALALLSVLTGGVSPQDLINTFSQVSGVELDPEKSSNTKIGQFLHLINMGKIDTSPHAVYARRGIAWTVDGKSGLDWTADYFQEALRNVNSPISLPPRSGNVLQNLSDEKSLEGDVSVGDSGEGNSSVDLKDHIDIETPKETTTPTTTKKPTSSSKETTTSKATSTKATSEPKPTGTKTSEPEGTTETTQPTKPSEPKPSETETPTTNEPSEGNGNGGNNGENETTSTKPTTDSTVTKNPEPTPKPGSGSETDNGGDSGESGSEPADDKGHTGSNHDDSDSGVGVNTDTPKPGDGSHSDNDKNHEPDSKNPTNGVDSTKPSNGTHEGNTSGDSAKTPNGENSVATNGNNTHSVSSGSSNANNGSVYNVDRNYTTNDGEKKVSNSQQLVRTGPDMLSLFLLVLFIGVGGFLIWRSFRK